MSNTQERESFEKAMLSLLSKMKANASNKEPIFVTNNIGKQILGDRIAGFNVISNEVKDDTSYR